MGHLQCWIYEAVCENPIYIFSLIDKNEKLDKIKSVTRIKLDETFVNTPFNIETFRDSLVVVSEDNKNTFLRNINAV